MRHIAQRLLPVPAVLRGNLDIIDQDPAPGRVQKPQYQVDRRGFAGPGAADDPDGRMGRDMHVQPVEGGPVRIRIAVFQRLDLQMFRQGQGRRGRPARPRPARLDIPQVTGDGLHDRPAAAQRGQHRKQNLQRRQQPHARKSDKAQGGDHLNQAPGVPGQIEHDEDQHAPERDDLKDIAGHVAQDLHHGAGPRHDPGRCVEAGGIDVFQAAQLDVFDAFKRLLGHAKPFCVRIEAALAQPRQVITHRCIDAHIGHRQHAGDDGRHHRFGQKQ